jgi:hypothetical protein
MHPRNMQKWAEARFGPDWRRKGVVVMETWAALTFGPNWRQHALSANCPKCGGMLTGNGRCRAALRKQCTWKGQLEPDITRTRFSHVRYEPKHRVTLTADSVMADCREWFMAHTTDVGWRQRIVVNSGMGTDVMRAARRRIERGEWEYCAICRLPVYQTEREPLPGGQARHPFCDPLSDRDAPDTPASGIVDARQQALPV